MGLNSTFFNFSVNLFIRFFWIYTWWLDWTDKKDYFGFSRTIHPLLKSGKWCLFGLKNEKKKKKKKQLFFLFLQHFKILFRIIYDKKTYFINYNVQTNKQKTRKTRPSTTHFTRPSDYWKLSSPYSPVLILPSPLPPTQSLNQIR